MRLLFVTLIAVGLLCGACQQPSPRLNAPPHGVAVNTSELRDTFEQMVDNALLEDMAVYDSHFYPHRPLLNSLGEQQIARLAGLMEMYGGEIRFYSAEQDEDLVAARADAIVAHLSECGVDTTREVLIEDLPGGSGMDATQAILIKANEGVYKPRPKSSKPALTDNK